jgi:non-heme chloroperoxidase
MFTVRTQDNVGIAYRTAGVGPLNLLFMHGWGGSGAYFDEMLKHLDLTGLRAITYDLRGHGDSDKPEIGYTLDRYAQDAFDVADHLYADKIVVVGFSMSGKFAQYLACAQPERVIGLILVAGSPAAAIPFPDETLRDWVGRAGNRERMMEITRMFTTQPVQPEVIERWGDDAVKVPQMVLEETLKMTVETTFVDRLSSVRAPTLVVGGIHDPIFTPDTLRQAVVAPLSGARLALLDCSHEIPIEQPIELAALIQAFVTSVSATSNVVDSASVKA